MSNDNFKFCNHERDEDSFKNHRIKGGNVTVEEVLKDDFKVYKIESKVAEFYL